MQKKTFSQKAAQIFEIAGCLFLIPAIISLFFPILLFFGGLIALRPEISILALIPILIFGIGLVLFIGYVKHWRGTLGERKILPLWSATFLFNFWPMIILAVLFYSDARQRSESLNFFSVLLIFWWMTACCLSLTAVYDELKLRDGFFRSRLETDAVRRSY